MIDHQLSCALNRIYTELEVLKRAVEEVKDILHVLNSELIVEFEPSDGEEDETESETESEDGAQTI